MITRMRANTDPWRLWRWSTQPSLSDRQARLLTLYAQHAALTGNLTVQLPRCRVRELTGWKLDTISRITQQLARRALISITRPGKFQTITLHPENSADRGAVFLPTPKNSANLGAVLGGDAQNSANLGVVFPQPPGGTTHCYHSLSPRSGEKVNGNSNNLRAHTRAGDPPQYATPSAAPEEPSVSLAEFRKHHPEMQWP